QTPHQQVGRDRAGGDDQEDENQGAEAGDGRTGGGTQDVRQRPIDCGEQRFQDEERAPERDDDGEARQEVPLHLLRNGHATCSGTWPCVADHSRTTAVPIMVTVARWSCVGSTSRRTPTTPLPPRSIAWVFRSASARSIALRSEEHTSGLQSRADRVCRVLL